MPATLFLSPSSCSYTPPKPHYLSYNPNRYSHSYLVISSSLNPKPHHNPKHTDHSSNFLSLTSTEPNPDTKTPLEPISRSDAAVKMPTAPWMKGPLVLQPHEVVDLSKPGKDEKFNNGKPKKAGSGLTDKLVGRRGKNVIKKIARKIQKLGDKVDLEETQKASEEMEIGGYLGRLGETGDLRVGGKLPWERDESFVFRRMKKEKAVTAAELRLEKELLERLRGEAYKIRKWVKVKKAGVTQDVVDDVKFIWKRNELAMVKFDIPLCRNMDRAQEIVEVDFFHCRLLFFYNEKVPT